MAQSETLAVLDRRWHNACKVVFKEDIGPLSDYLPWLSGLVEPLMHRKSSVSRKEVTYAIREYAQGAKWTSLDEVDFNREFEPLSINEIKDLDSLLSAVSGRACYCGNIVLGNSGFVERSSNITDSFYLQDCSLLSDSKYNLHVSTGRLSEDSFGVYGPGESQHCIRCSQTYRDRRCFELWMSQNCSDCCYVYNLDSCTDCIFCFNARNKRHCIGNLELERGKYSGIKEKLLAEMADELKRKKKLPSLMEIAAKSPFEKPVVHPSPEERQDDSGKKAAEAGFQKTSRLLLGKELRDIDTYRKWLERHIWAVEDKESVASGRTTRTAPHAVAVVEMPEKRIVTVEEALEIGKNSISGSDAASLSLQNCHETIKNLAFFPVEFYTGTNVSLTQCTVAIECALSYRTSTFVYSKYCGCNFYPRSTEHAFGCNQLFDSSFCINCYYSVKLTRCFECDSCRGCSDCYFCHNCENLTDCMFCFNAKSKRYAIGNVEVGRENYLKVKKMLLEEIDRKLEKDHDLKIDIYNVGLKGKR